MKNTGLFGRVPLIVAAVMFLGGSIAVAAEEIPLPDDVVILSPAPGLPDDLAGFIGKWGEGRWSGNLMPVEVVIENIRADGRASVIYAHPDYPDWNTRAGYLRGRGFMLDGWLITKFRGLTLNLKVPENDTIEGTNAPNIHLRGITLKRQKYPIWKRLTAAEIRETFTGKTATIWHEKKEFPLQRYYAPDGTIFTRTPFSETPKKGFWFIDEQGRLCERANPMLKKHLWCQVVADNGEEIARFFMVTGRKRIPRPIKTFTYRSFSDGNTL
ncbi:MAG TPA: hypothetical protein ENI96_04595 [Sedimenticola thiotaurini]|uniref:Uncharacterized protein n=1 Tax=Sedimenticola thiotaurini TaxID=1543721 RepID=A0A831RNC3_9GAMM|nr:hypothetical protein [Sedimenticola thiotaurini]